MAYDNMITRIGWCIEVILMTWLLWKPIHCNTNRLNGINPKLRTSKLLSNFHLSNLKPNTSDNHQIPISNNSTSSLVSSSKSSSNLNYLLSSLEEEGQQSEESKAINEKSEKTSSTLVAGPKRDNNEIELGVEDREGVDSANKLSLFSSSLNVIDVEPQDTQLAHSVLIIHRPKPNKTVKPTIKPQQQSITYLTRPKSTKPPVSDSSQPANDSPRPANDNPRPANDNPRPVNNYPKPVNNNPLITAITNITTTTTSYPTPVKNNHRPMNNLPFIGLRAKHRPSTTLIASSTTTSTTSTTPMSTTSTTTTTTPSTTSTAAVIEILNVTSKTEGTLNTTLEVPVEAMPVIMKNNHKRPSISLSEFTRQKLSTEYALIFTTPGSSSTSDKIISSEDPTMTTPSYITSIRPPYVTPINHQTSSLVSVMKRPPIKIMTVNANKIKQPEEVYSHGITVLDPPYVPGFSGKLPPNTTIVHKNLIVPMKEGRPKPFLPVQTTTQFPVYPMVAGITKWHTQTPTTSWPYPIITTSSPENIDYTPQTQTVASEATSDSPLETTVTAQTVHRPTVITSHPTVSKPSAAHLVTVTPLKATSDSSHAASNAFIVTHSSPRPSSSTTGYVNAIWAPPMPVYSQRPAQSTQQVTTAPVSGGWFSPLTNLFSVDSPNGMFSMLTIMKTVLFTVLVMFLPPLTLAAALMQAAAG